MCKLKSGMVAYLLAQPGILSLFMRRHPSLGERIEAWLTGEKPVLIIGGEPGHGKSLFMGELALRHNEFTRLHSHMVRSLALISYDYVHYLFLKRLAEVHRSHPADFLPEGITHPEARRFITQILRDIVVFALLHFPKEVPIILEAPLIDHRGEDFIDELRLWASQMQILIIYSPRMSEWVMRQEKQQARARSAQTRAMKQIHNTLLHQRGIAPHLSKHEQDRLLLKSWEQWLGHRDGIVLSWNPADDEESFFRTKEALQIAGIHPDPLVPHMLDKYAIMLIEVLLEMIPDLESFAEEVHKYKC